MKYAFWLIVAFVGIGFAVRYLSDKTRDSQLLPRIVGQGEQAYRESSERAQNLELVKTLRAKARAKTYRPEIFARYDATGFENLVGNGTFADPDADGLPAGWRFDLDGELAPCAGRTTDTPDTPLRLFREKSGGKPGGMRFERPVDRKTGDALRIVLALDVRIVSHDMTNTGIQNDLDDKAWGDAPVFVGLVFADKTGARHYWQWNFLTKHDGNTILENYSVLYADRINRVELDILDRNSWRGPNPVYPKRLPAPDEIVRIVVGGSGWDFDVYIGNVELRMYTQDFMATLPSEPDGLAITGAQTRALPDDASGGVAVTLPITGAGTDERLIFEFTVETYCDDMSFVPASSVVQPETASSAAKDGAAQAVIAVPGSDRMAGRTGVAKIGIQDSRSHRRAVAFVRFTMPEHAKTVLRKQPVATEIEKTDAGFSEEHVPDSKTKRGRGQHRSGE